MSKKSFLITSILCYIFSTIFFATKNYAESQNLGYIEGELLVRFAPKSDGKQKTILEKNEALSVLKGATVKRTFNLVQGLSLVELPSDVNVRDALKEFQKSKDFLYVEPNYKIKAFNTFPNDPNISYLWGMHNTGQTGGTIDADIDAPEA